MHWCNTFYSLGGSHLLLSLLSITAFFQPFSQAVDRDVYGVVDCDFKNGLYDSSGALLTPQHGAVHIVSSGEETALRIQIIGEEALDQPQGVKYYMDVLDMGKTTKLPGGKATFGVERVLTYHGTTSLTNQELFDPDTGKGILRDLWTNKDLGFTARYKPGSSSCMPFANALTKPNGPLGANIAFSADWTGLFGNYQEWMKNLGQSSWRVDNCGLRRRTFGATRSDPKTIIEYPIKSITPENIIDRVDISSSYDLNGDRIDSCGRTPQDARGVLLPWDEPQVEARAYKVTAGGTVDASMATTKEIIVAKTGGIAQQVVSIGKGAAAAAGVAGLAVGAVFVILDFVNKNWVGAAIGLAGTAIGLATMGIGGPVGWIVGGLITAFFAILPTLFKKPAKKPTKGNIAEAIQFVMFGDAAKTGNEQCKDQNPDCQALYGPGVIAMSFGWDYFDAVAFLVSSNDGYPMSIIDMANHIKSDGEPNANATLKCSLPKPGPANAFSPDLNGGPSNSCESPKFLWHGDLVTLPYLDQTADAIKKRLIDSNGNGDCKMDDPSSEKINFQSYGFSVTGLPVSIACNITAGTNLNGHLLPLDQPSADGSSTSQNSDNTTDVVLPGNSSTSGQNGAYIAPPANPQPLKAPFTSDNAICFKSSASDNPVCLPSGVYGPQQGTFGLKTSAISEITMPGGGCSLKIDHTVTYGGRWPGSKVVPLWQNDSISDVQSNKDLKEAFSQLDIPANKGRTFELSIPDSAPKLPPAVGFFGDIKYMGDVYWLGEGGGNLTDAQSQATKSAKLVGGATAYVFVGEGYADKSEQRIQGDVEDMSGVKLADGDFSGKVKGLWVVGGAATSQNHKRKRRRAAFAEIVDLLTIDS